MLEKLKTILLIFLKCPRLNVNRDIINIQVAEIIKQEFNINKGILLMAKSGNVSILDILVECIPEKHRKSILSEEPFRYAVLNGHLPVIKYIINKGIDNWDIGLLKAAEGRHIDLIDFFIKKGAVNWNAGMYGAARGGHKDLVKFFIQKGAHFWEGGRIFAVMGGYDDLVNFFIEKGFQSIKKS